jgi:GTP 3',8-cyclase
MPLLDKFGRIHDYLRISVTDRCNLRCVYCMPEKGMEFLPKDQVLSDDEIVFTVTVAAKLGVRKLRFTGGEPLVRPNIEQLIARCANIDGIDDIALSTNAVLLAKRAASLKQAGVTRVNISLDSFKPDRFKWVTRGGEISQVLAGLEASEQVGFTPIKLNVVLMKGINDDEVEDFLRFSMDRNIFVRFIEYMPIGHADEVWKQRYLPLSYVLDSAAVMTGSQPKAVDSPVRGNGPAEYYQLPGAKGAFGLIHPVSDHFCASCNRLRLTADGHFKACLFWQQEHSVRHVMNDEVGMAQLIQSVLDGKPESHEMAKVLNGEQLSQEATLRRMSQIGG